jgi:hypothetical protein
MRETYNYRETKPFGTYAAFNLLKQSYPAHVIEINNEDFADYYLRDSDTSSLYINISKNFYATEREISSLLTYVWNGNTAFIAAANIDTLLLNKMFCTQKNNEFINLFKPKPYTSTAVRLISALSETKTDYTYFFLPFANAFPTLNGGYSRKMGYNADSTTNFFIFYYGKGKLYLHAEPRAFSNYFLLTANNHEYLKHIYEVLPPYPEKIYWDNHYNKENYHRIGRSSFSTFSTIMKYPALANAFWIALTLLLLYIFFNSKRRQRIVPVLKTPDNTSIAFAEAIAGLYLSEKDNKLIADKMITYFNEFLRTKYFITGTINDPGYADTLSKKSGVAPDQTIALVNAITGTVASKNISDRQLLELNGLIENFYKNKV